MIRAGDLSLALARAECSGHETAVRGESGRGMQSGPEVPRTRHVATLHPKAPDLPAHSKIGVECARPFRLPELLATQRLHGVQARGEDCGDEAGEETRT